MTGQGIFNVLVFLIGALSQLVPSFKEWWDNFKYRDVILLAACVVVAGVFVFLCEMGVDIGSCVFPTWPDGVLAGIGAARDAFALFLAAQMFMRVGQWGVRALRARLAG